MSLRVVKLVAENVKGLKAVDITPDEHFQVISGKNGHGKSSVLDAIWYAFGGAEALKGTTKPIRDGEDQASVMLDLGDMVVSRRWKGANTALSVNAKDGAKYSSPQAMLDSLVGRLSFDPFAFSNMKDAEQKKTLLEMVELSVDPDALDAKRKELYDQRTFANRELKQFEGQLAGIERPTVDLPDNEVSVGEVLAKISVANARSNDNAKKRERLSSAIADYHSKKADIAHTEEKVAELEASLKHEKQRLSDLQLELSVLAEKEKQMQATVDALEDPNFEVLEIEMQSIEATNREIRNAAAYRALLQSIEAKKSDVNALTEQITAIDMEKQDALASASFPIEGLGFDEHGVTYQSIPFCQCSKGERIKISMAMAMAMNPKLRVIRIMDGGLLDEDNLKLIEEMANENDYQVWVEMVDASGKVGIYIENGEVKIQELESAL